MRTGIAARWLVVLTVAGALGVAGTVAAQVNGLYYREVERDGRVYVFNTPERFASWQESGEMGTGITLIGFGPNGETVVGENETALDLYSFKHGLEGYERPTPQPAKPSLPTAIKIGDGELKFGALLQAWYVGDDSDSGSGTSYLGNSTGANTFRLRRAELKLSGTITPAWGFELMFDPAKTQSSNGGDDKILQDLAISYLGQAGHWLAVGQKKIALTEEGLRSRSPAAVC